MPDRHPSPPKHERAAMSAAPRLPIKAPLKPLTIAAIFLPVVVFYVELLRECNDIPYWDDYDALDFLTQLSKLPTVSAKIGFLLSFQHNEYRLVFENLIFALQNKLSGHVSFMALALLGNGFALCMFYVLWRNFLPAEQNRNLRLQLFIPVAFVLFQLNYAETLNWSMAGLQNLTVIAFSLLCLHSLCKSSRTNFALACAACILAIASSGNGLILWPLGFLILLQTQRRTRATLWAALGLLITILYFHNYKISPAPQPLVATSSYWSRIRYPVFTLSFLGSGVGMDRFIFRFASLLLGLAICVAIYLMASRRYWKINPVLSSFVVFLVVTALGVSVIRSQTGYLGSFASRYRIYSDLLLICVYAFLCETVLEKGKRFRVAFTQSSVYLAILFCLYWDVNGSHYLHRRSVDNQHGVELYQNSQGTLGPAFLSSESDGTRVAQINMKFRKIMREAEVLNLYHFPKSVR
jgi:hypothetical protein